MPIALWASLISIRESSDGPASISRQPFRFMTKRSFQAYWRARRRPRSTVHDVLRPFTLVPRISDRAEENCRQGLQFASKLGHAFTSAQADFYPPGSMPSRGIFFAPGASQKGRSVAPRFNNYGLVLGLSRVIRGWTMSRTGEHAAGEEEIEQGTALIRGPHADICESSFLTFLADHYLITGDSRKAWRSSRS